MIKALAVVQPNSYIRQQNFNDTDNHLLSTSYFGSNALYGLYIIDSQSKGSSPKPYTS